MNPVSITQCDRFVVVWMAVAIEHRPDLVGLFERVSATTAAPAELLRLDPLHGSLRYRVRNTHTGDDFHCD